MKKGTLLLISSIILSVLNSLLSIKLIADGVCTLNRGIAFGVRIEYEVLITALLLFLLVCLSIYIKNIFRYNILSIVMLGISNLFMRIMYGGVCDYIDLFGVNVNIADIGIVTICILSIVYIVKEKDKE